MSRQRPRRYCAPAKQRKGTIVILTALVMVLLMALLAFSIDTGYMYTMQTQLDRSVDAAALAGAGALVEGTTLASDQAIEYLVRNPIGPGTIIANESQLVLMKTKFLEQHEESLQIAAGSWNPETQMFEESQELPSALRVSITYPNNPLFFARILGRDSFTIKSESIAMFQPRDIMLVLDLSASMNDDSELKSIDSMGRTAVEANLLQIYQDLGSPTFGIMQWQPQYISGSNYKVRKKLGLLGVPYPYSSGSWNDYISYVKSSDVIADAGYTKKYGYLTLVNYWLEKQPGYSQTQDLWRASAQPATAVKDSVDLFLQYIQQVDTEDRIGLAVYNSSNGNGTIETGLTQDFDLVGTMSRARQAGHYHNYTNIGAGMAAARAELQANGRPGAFKMIVLMTDGRANWVNGGYSTNGAVNYVRAEAREASDLRYPVITISLGAGADVALMEEVAEITESVHFNVPGGQSVEEYREDLIDVFKEIADHRPLKLVK